jgi:hypothetical protein
MYEAIMIIVHVQRHFTTERKEERILLENREFSVISAVPNDLGLKPE